MDKPLLTVFTPTYNRAGLIGRVYESLKKQTVKDFKWIIVDDGSTDDTKAVVDAFISHNAENGFATEYHYQDNGGKMRAHNTGSRLCDTELFLCVDSDDMLTEDAAETIVSLWRAADDGINRAGIAAYKGELADGKIRKFRDASFMAGDIERGYETLRGLYLHGFFGETTLVFRSDLLKKYPFPEIDGEKYVPEDYIYDKIDKECPLLVLPKVLTVCELCEGGYTDAAKKLRRENPMGWFLYYEQRSSDQKWSVLKIKYLSHYIIFSRIVGKEIKLSVIERVLGSIGAAILTMLGKS